MPSDVSVMISPKVVDKKTYELTGAALLPEQDLSPCLSGNAKLTCIYQLLFCFLLQWDIIWWNALKTGKTIFFVISLWSFVFFLYYQEIS